jgi:hypothetical protein
MDFIDVIYMLLWSQSINVFAIETLIVIIFVTTTQHVFVCVIYCFLFARLESNCLIQSCGPQRQYEIKRLK